MQAEGQDSPSSFFQTLPTYAKVLLVTAGAAAAGGAAFYLWKSFNGDPFAPYPEQPDGVVRMFCEELLEERDAATKGVYEEKKLWKAVAQANKNDDYEQYINCLQDLTIFYAIREKPDKALNCVNRQVKCIKRRLKSADLGSEYPIVCDYLKCLVNKVEQCERVGKSMLSSRVLEKAVKIEAFFFESKGTTAGLEGTKVDWTKLAPPRVLYNTLFEVLKNAKPQSEEENQAVIDKILAIQKYCEAHLPAEKGEWSTDELQFTANVAGTLAAMYLGAQEPNKSLIWLKAAEANFACLPEMPSIILQRTLLLRQLAECYFQLGDFDIAVEHMQSCVEGLIQIIGDAKEDEPVMLLIECTGLLINLLGAQHQASPTGNSEALQKINKYQQFIMNKYPEQLEKLMQAGGGPGAPPAGGEMGN